MGRVRRTALRLLPALAVVAVVSLTVLGVQALHSSLASAPPPPKRMVQQISIIKPPPPPPPPKVEEPPEPEVQEQVDLLEPEAAEQPPESPGDDAAPGGDLGLDADGVAGGDAFGLVGKKGGQALIGSPDRFVWFSRRAAREVGEWVEQRPELRRRGYAVELRLWFEPGGRVTRVELVGSTGDRDLDAGLRLALEGRRRFRDAPPAGMPQPLRIRVTSTL